MLNEKVQESGQEAPLRVTASPFLSSSSFCTSQAGGCTLKAFGAYWQSTFEKFLSAFLIPVKFGDFTSSGNGLYNAPLLLEAMRSLGFV